MDSNFKKGIFQKKLLNEDAQCLTCERKCVIKKGLMGLCQTRMNINGEIHSIVYGKIPASSINPIEKKPFFHFYPGSKAITIGTYGCNFSCFWCQNYHLSHPNKSIKDLVKSANFISPDTLIKMALKKGAQGTSISFNEPTLLFEYSLEVFKKAKEVGLYNTYVSNGYMTESVLKKLIDTGLDAINIDIKGDSKMVKNYCGVDVEHIWRNARIAKENGVHLEITTLLIENFNTDKDIVRSIAERIMTELGDDTPFHLSRFFPYYKSHEHKISDATPLSSLYKAYGISSEAGLKYVYLGNVSSKKYESTFCPNCKSLTVEREGFLIKKIGLDHFGKCKKCGNRILSNV
jgi:pyruvate formate lyase activating enzyme